MWGYVLYWLAFCGGIVGLGLAIFGLGKLVHFDRCVSCGGRVCGAGFLLTLFPVGVLLLWLAFRVKRSGAGDETAPGAYLLKGLAVLGFALSFWIPYEAFKLIFLPKRSGILSAAKDEDEVARDKATAEQSAVNAGPPASPSLRDSAYLCPGCGARLGDTGQTKRRKIVRGPKQPILACQPCDKNVDGPPSIGSLAVGWVELIIGSIVGLFLLMFGILGVTSGYVLLGCAFLIPGLGLASAAMIIGIDVGRGGRDRKYWMQYRQA